MFSFASTLLFKIASPAFEKAYERGRSIWDARDELNTLRRSIKTIQAGLLDAEKKQESSALVKDWIERAKEVLYDADDLFDEVATDDMLKQHIIKEGKLLKKVQAYCFKLNPIVSRNSIATKVKAIRKSLVNVSNEMAQFEFAKSVDEQPISNVRKGKEVGSFIDSEDVIGRDKDKKTILEWLLDDRINNGEQHVSVIAIVGIGGMGKTTLAQLVYNDEEVQEKFEKRWFACISNTSDNKEIMGKIFQSICKKSYLDVTLSQLQTEIRESIQRKKFLLVLDDVWEEDHASWQCRMSLLRCGAKGSKIIVTTRSSSVAMAFDALKTHNLEGLSEDGSWDLFKRLAFTHEQERDSRWIDLGRRIVRKCANVPLAIRSIGSLLYTKTTIEEWESIMKGELAQEGERGHVPIISVLKLSYDHLHSNLKQCFAYCSLFPKDYVFNKQDLIYLWNAQGYIKPKSDQTFEEVGHSYFMNLLQMSFFQEAMYDRWGEIGWCKMHDFIHDLAQHVAAEESFTLTTSTTEMNGTPRHAKVGCIASDSSGNLATLWNGNRLRSLCFINMGSTRGLILDQEFAKLKFLRTLKLPRLGIENVPISIGELKLLRYLDLSMNKFKRLPDSITNLLNLCTLDLSWCMRLEALPIDFRKLVNLRHLKIKMCIRLRYVLAGLWELASLQHLDEFNVSRDQGNKLGDIFGLKIRGQLDVLFIGDSEDDEWNGVECWQPLVNLQGLHIEKYNGMRIPHWANRRSADSPSLLLPNLAGLSLLDCNSVKCLPPFRHLPNLKYLILLNMLELEYIEEEEEEEEENEGNQNLTMGSDILFLPYLNRLQFFYLPNLKGWSRRVEAALTSKDDVAVNGEEHSSSTSASASALLPSFPSLSTIEMIHCVKLKYMPLCPNLRVLMLEGVDTKVIPQLLSIRDHSSPPTTTTSPSSSLEKVHITGIYGGLKSFPGQSLTSLRHLRINCCERLQLPPSDLNLLEHLDIRGCWALEKSCWSEFWAKDDRKRWWEKRFREWEKEEEDNRTVDWDSLRNLRKLWANRIPSPERLPDCLRNLQSQGKLQIKDYNTVSRTSSRSLHLQHPFYQPFVSNPTILPSPLSTLRQ